MVKLKTQSHEYQTKLVQLIENQFVGTYLHLVKDEMALKTVLRCVRSLIVYTHEQKIETRHQLYNLISLCNVKDEAVDFFSNCLSIKLKERQRSMKILKTKLETSEFKGAIKTVEHVIMPIVEYLVFGGATQRKNLRDTISYER